MHKNFFKTILNREIYFEYVEGEGTPIIFLNGLSDSYQEWKSVVSLSDLKRPILFVDLIGQGKALEKEFSSKKKHDYRVTVDQQGLCLTELCDYLKIKKFSLVGFSYGGGVALWVAHQFSERTQDLILFLPFILRLDLSFPMSRLLHFQYDLIKKMTPGFMQAPYQVIEKSYEHFVHDYMHFRFSNRIPDEFQREAAVQISEGIMNFNVFNILNDIPDHRLHLVSADLDTLIPRSLMREFWNRLPEQKKLSWTQVMDGEHLLLEQNPRFVAQLLSKLLVSDKQAEPQEYKLFTNVS